MLEHGKNSDVARIAVMLSALTFGCTGNEDRVEEADADKQPGIGTVVVKGTKEVPAEELAENASKTKQGSIPEEQSPLGEASLPTAKRNDAVSDTGVVGTAGNNPAQATNNDDAKRTPGGLTAASAEEAITKKVITGSQQQLSSYAGDKPLVIEFQVGGKQFELSKTADSQGVPEYWHPMLSEDIRKICIMAGIEHIEVKTSNNHLQALFRMVGDEQREEAVIELVRPEDFSHFDLLNLIGKVVETVAVNDNPVSSDESYAKIVKLFLSQPGRLKNYNDYYRRKEIWGEYAKYVSAQAQYNEPSYQFVDHVMKACLPNPIDEDYILKPDQVGRVIQVHRTLRTLER